MDALYKKILKEVEKMSDEEFQAELDKYSQSDIVLALQDMEDCLKEKYD